MALRDGKRNSILNEQWTAAERAGGVRYMFLHPIPAGTTLRIRRLEVPWEALLAFIDRGPGANSGRSCRYFRKREWSDSPVGTNPAIMHFPIRQTTHYKGSSR